MLTLYLICLAAGGLLIGLSIFGVGDYDGDLDGGTGADVDPGDAGDGVAAAARFFSVRGIIFGAAFFGLTGTLFTLLRVGPLLTVVFAAVWAVVAAASIQRLMGYLSQSENGEVSSRTLEGSVAEVVIDIDDETCGKVAVSNTDRTLQLVARPHAEAQVRHFRAGEEVVIAEVQDGTAYVVGTTFLA